MNLGPADSFPGADFFNPQINEKKDIDLGVLHPDDFLDTSKRVKTDFPTGSIYYLDYVGLGKSEDGYNQIGLKNYTKFFEVGTFETGTNLTEENVDDAKSILGIEIESVLKKSLIEEVNKNMRGHLYNKYKTLGEKTRQGSLNKYQTKLESKWDIPADIVLQNDETAGRRLGAKIIGAVNSIALSSRRGPGDFVVLNNILGSIITDSPEFIFKENVNMTIGCGIHQIGTFHEIKVFVNPFESENVAVVGRTPKEHDPGVYMFEYQCVLRNVQYQDIVNSLGIKSTTSIRNRTAYSEVGQKPESCYRTMRFVLSDRIPAWRKLLNKIVKPPIL